MKSIKFAVAALAAMSIAFAAVAQDKNSVVEKYGQAKEFSDKKNYAAAAPLFEQVISEGTKVGSEVAGDVANAKNALPQIYRMIASQQASQGKWNEAIASATTAQRKATEYKNNVEIKKAQDLLIRIYLKQGQDLATGKKYTEAIPFLEKAYAIDQNNASASFTLATAYVESGKKAEGFAIFNKMIERGNSNARYKDAANRAQAKMESYQNIAASEAYNAKNYSQAISLADALIKENPKNANAQMIVIRSLNAQKKYSDLIKRAPTAIQAQGAEEDKSEIYFLVGVAYNNIEDTPKAIENFRKVTKGNYLTQAKTQITELSK